MTFLAASALRRNLAEITIKPENVNFSVMTADAANPERDIIKIAFSYKLSSVSLMIVYNNLGVVFNILLFFLNFIEISN